ncbi:MAG: cyclic nucleotide-binding domain-containing protein [Anaerolineales bacterium]
MNDHQNARFVLELSMPIEASDLATFLTTIHLFHYLSEEQVAIVAAGLKELHLGADVEVIKEGAEVNSLYLIYSGSVSVTRTGRQAPLARLVRHDYFGEAAVLKPRKLNATVKTLEPTVVLILSGEKFKEFIKQIPGLRANFAIMVASQKLANRLHFSWVREDEVIYFLAQKHPYRLVEALVLPVLSLLLPAALLIVFLLFPAFLLILWGAGVTLRAIVLWIIWRTIDWGNDYYVVTNQRVIYLEKVIGLYDSTQEAPLSTILSVGVETDMMGRQMGFGNVIIRTYVGKIIFWHVSNPKQAAAVVEEHWQRVRETSRRAENDAMRLELRKRMGLIPAEARPQPGPAAVVVKPKASFAERLSLSLFKVRIEKGGTVTYRKSIFVLFLQIWQPTLGLAILVVLLAIGLIHTPNSIISLAPGLASETLFTIWVVLFFVIILWWIYQYIDWSNDIFQVTPDQILDIDRKPFGTEERRAAPLENILSTQAQREGFLAYLLNFGTVYINVGGSTELRFSDVTDPATVQQDIDNRRLARINSKAEIQAKADRERLADWFITYQSVNKEVLQAASEQKYSSDSGEPDGTGEVKEIHKLQDEDGSK